MLTANSCQERHLQYKRLKLNVANFWGILEEKPGQSQVSNVQAFFPQYLDVFRSPGLMRQHPVGQQQW